MAERRLIDPSCRFSSLLTWRIESASLGGGDGGMKPGGWRRSRARGERINIGSRSSAAMVALPLWWRGAAFEAEVPCEQ